MTHGQKVSPTSHYYNAVHYTLNEEGKLDYDEIIKLWKEYKPKLILPGATAYPLKIDLSVLAELQKVGTLIAYLYCRSVCVIGEHPHPFSVACDVIISPCNKILRVTEAGVIVCKKNMVLKLTKLYSPALQADLIWNTIAAMVVAFKEAMSEEYKAYAEQVVKNAKVLSEKLKEYKFKLILVKLKSFDS